MARLYIFYVADAVCSAITEETVMPQNWILLRENEVNSVGILDSPFSSF